MDKTSLQGIKRFADPKDKYINEDVRSFLVGEGFTRDSYTEFRMSIRRNGRDAFNFIMVDMHGIHIITKSCISSWFDSVDKTFKFADYDTFSSTYNAMIDYINS